MHEFYSLKSLAVRMDVSIRVLAYWASRGIMPGAVKFGREWRVKASVVDAWIEQKLNEGPAWRQSTNEKTPPSGKRKSSLTGKSTGSALKHEFDLKLQKLQESAKNKSV